MKSSSWARVFVLSALALLLASVTAWGQAGTSIIRGEITDPQGKLVPKATVTIKNEGTGFTRTEQTTAGSFSFDLIPPGDYTVEIEAEGFKKSVLTHVHALVGSPVDASTQLELGTVGETVQVEASAVQINTQDATLGNNFVNQQILQLPLESRNITALLTLQPGVTRDGYVAGARSDQSNVTLDGVDINDQQIERTIAGQTVVNPLNTPVLRLNSEAIEEFRVTTLNPNANQGRSSAAQVNLVTKGGTNSFHGSAFEAHRNTIFAANDFFNNRATPQVPRPKLIRNTFGGSAGGPLKKDKLFFFYSYEGRRDAAGTSVVRTVPLANLGLGQMRVRAQHCTDPTNQATCGPVQVVTLTTAQLANNVWPAVGINPAGVAVLADAVKRYPSNDNTQGDGLNTGGFRFNASTPVDLNSHVAKVDWIVNSNQTAFIRINNIYDHIGLLPQFPDTPAPTLWSHPWGLVASHTWTIGSQWVNNFRYGLTRQAFSQLGDNNSNNVNFRFVFQPFAYSRTLARTTPVHNIVDDVSRVKGSHTIQFGTNIRLIRNTRNTFANAFDSVVTNPSGYQQGGVVVSDPVASFLNSSQNLNVLLSVSEAQNAGTALIGRFSQYTANFTFSHDGSLLPSGTSADRTFATEQYDFYLQDAWRVRRNLTLTFGVRYGLGRPIYETNGFEVKPNIPLSDYFGARVASAAQGVPFNVPITMELSGPANGRSPMYPWDWSNIQPRGAIAWQPNFSNGLLKKLFGEGGKSVIRAGFARTNDYFGEALATFFDLNNVLGYSSSQVIPVNTYNVTDKPAPPFTGFNQDVRTLPKITVPGSVVFPQLQPSDMGERIEGSLDSKLHAPTEYTFSLTLERELRAGITVQASYIGRLGRSLLAQRDAMALNDLVDPKTGMDWYTAATALEVIRQTRGNISNRPARDNFAVRTMPYFDNIFPSNLRDVMVAFEGLCKVATNCIPAGFTPTQTIFWIARNIYNNDWTDTQADLDVARFEKGQPTLFFNPQYGALTAWSTIGNSNFHGLALSVRQRYRSLSWDFNYTYSHSLDDASGLQNGASYAEAAFILNPIRQQDWYANSTFDIRHVININGIYQLPFGRGRFIGSGVGRGLDALIGGWQISGIFRWNTGVPLSAPFDDARWATNWNVQSRTVLTKALEPCVTKGNATTAPKLFGCDTIGAYQSFRNAFPGESGQRNIFRLPSFINLDMGLSKAFTMPWNEGHKLQLRWEVFNVTNTQRFGNTDNMDLSRTGYGLRLDPAVRNLNPPANWSNFTGIQGSPRVMQIGARFEF